MLISKKALYFVVSQLHIMMDLLYRFLAERFKIIFMEGNMYSVLTTYNWPLILLFSFISILFVGFLVYYFTLKIKAIKKFLENDPNK